MGDFPHFLGIDLYLAVVEDTTEANPIPLTVSIFPIPRFPDSLILRFPILVIALPSVSANLIAIIRSTIIKPISTSLDVKPSSRAAESEAGPRGN